MDQLLTRLGVLPGVGDDGPGARYLLGGEPLGLDGVGEDEGPVGRDQQLGHAGLGSESTRLEPPQVAQANQADAPEAEGLEA
jgi:hypothetical protein